MPPQTDPVYVLCPFIVENHSNKPIRIAILERVKLNPNHQRNQRLENLTNAMLARQA